jgi:hypothetical protein
MLVVTIAVVIYDHDLTTRRCRGSDLFKPCDIIGDKHHLARCRRFLSRILSDRLVCSNWDAGAEVFFKVVEWLATGGNVFRGEDLRDEGEGERKDDRDRRGRLRSSANQGT